MRAILRSLLSLGALAVAADCADGASLGAQSAVDNVVIELSSSPGGVTACLTTLGGAKLSGPYGVAVRAMSAAAAWDEPMPKMVAVEDDYFALPLRIDLKRRLDAAKGGRLQFEVGACQPEGMCIPVELAIDAASVAPATHETPCKG